MARCSNAKLIYKTEKSMLAKANSNNEINVKRRTLMPSASAIAFISDDLTLLIKCKNIHLLPYIYIYTDDDSQTQYTN